MASGTHSEAAWHAVDAYVADRLLGDDPALAAALVANAGAGLPDRTGPQSRARISRRRGGRGRSR